MIKYCILLSQQNRNPVVLSRTSKRTEVVETVVEKIVQSKK